MSDKTFGVKVSEELHEKVKNMIEVSGGNAKVWFEKAVALTAIQDLKDGSGAYKQDLSELEVHTTRIYELVANMIQRADYMKMDAVKGLEGTLESRELIITELQNNVQGLTEESKRLEDERKQAESDKKELTEQVESFRAANDNNQALIQEYKEKIDTLSSLVNEYKGYAKENAELKIQHTVERDQLKAEFEEKERRMISLNDELRDSARELLTQNEQIKEESKRINNNHEKEIENLKVNHVNQLTQLAEKKDLEKERAILEIERAYQEKLEKSHEQYNEKLSRLYERLETKESPKKKSKGTEE
jgi:chromosome segregation ATPase